MTLNFKTANQFSCMTLWPKFGYRKFSSWRGIVHVNTHWNSEPFLWPWPWPQQGYPISSPDNPAYDDVPYVLCICCLYFFFSNQANWWPPVQWRNQRTQIWMNWWLLNQSNRSVAPQTKHRKGGTEESNRVSSRSFIWSSYSVWCYQHYVTTFPSSKHVQTKHYLILAGIISAWARNVQK